MNLYYPLEDLPVLSSFGGEIKVNPLTEIDISNSKITALSILLKCAESEISVDAWEYYYFGDAEFFVLTQAEADIKVTEYIRETLWAFNTDFLADHSNEDEVIFQCLSDNGLCEGNNSTIESLIIDFDEFVLNAVEADGRGHFLSGYDGEENKIGDYYIYRIN